MGVMNQARWIFSFTVAMVVSQLFSATACATLLVFYDPDTGNVSFDTSETRTGGVHLYNFRLNPFASTLTFRTENFVLASQSTLVENSVYSVGQVSLVDSLEGLITIGDILPVGLSEESWLSLFDGPPSTVFRDADQGLGAVTYSDLFATGTPTRRPPKAEFVYGRPEGEFDNRLNLIDPFTLTWAETATLIYRPHSGEVILDSTGEDGGYISSFLLQSEDAFLPDNFTPFLSGPFTGASTSTVGLFGDAIEPGQYSLGNILEAGLTIEEYQATFSSADFLGIAGFPGNSFDWDLDSQTINLVYQAIPEPISLSSTMFIVLLLIACRGFVSK